MVFILPRAPLMPSSAPPEINSSVQVLSGADRIVWAEAQSLLAHAREQAEAIVASAQSAFEAERERGYAEGREKALLDQAEKMIETVGRTVDYFASVENDMVELVMQSVRRVVDGFDRRETVMAVVRNALAVVRNQKHMTLRLHPDDVNTVRARVNELLAAYPGVGYLDIMEDARLERGACILESEIGMVEASLDGQIAALRNAFQRMLGRRV